MDKLKIDNTNSFGAAGYVMNWVYNPNSSFGGIFKNELVALETGIMNFRFVQLGDIQNAYDILEKKLSNLENNKFEDLMKYVAETIQEYFGDYSNVSSRLENFPDEDEVEMFSKERGKVSDLQGKNTAACVERAMLSQNLLKYISKKLPGLESYFKETGIKIQRDEDKPTLEAHAFNLVAYNGKYYIFDSTIPKGTKDNLQPIVAELPEHVFTSLVESRRIGYAVELEHVSALTGKKMHYTLDYKAKDKYDSRLARKRNRIIFTRIWIKNYFWSWSFDRQTKRWSKYRRINIMKENTQEKSLAQINENSLFYRIKKFFKNLFNKNKDTIYDNSVIEETNNLVENENKKSSFMDSIKNIENEETKLLKLQKQYRSGEIKEEELTEEQVNSLCTLYDKQIVDLRKSNEIRKQRLLEYRRKLQTDN